MLKSPVAHDLHRAKRTRAARFEETRRSHPGRNFAKLLQVPPSLQSSRLARFLRFIIENSLSGTTERLKETVIGMEVYDWPADYDPKVDSIVRSEARRLRKKLQEYYEREGRYSKIIITIPTGGYLPQIEVLPQPIRELAVVTPPPEGSGNRLSSTHTSSHWNACCVRCAVGGDLVAGAFAASVAILSLRRIHLLARRLTDGTSKEDFIGPNERLISSTKPSPVLRSLSGFNRTMLLLILV